MCDGQGPQEMESIRQSYLQHDGEEVIIAGDSEHLQPLWG